MVLYKREGNLVKAYSDAGLKIRGGSPEGIYSVAYDPADCGREYVETGEPVDTMDRNPSAPRVFSKLKVVAALMKAGVWAQVKAWIEANGLYDLYLAAQEFAEDNEYFSQGKAALQSALGWTDEQVEAVLQEATK
jgi:hypothetical protein